MPLLVLLRRKKIFPSLRFNHINPLFHINCFKLLKIIFLIQSFRSHWLWNLSKKRKLSKIKVISILKQSLQLLWKEILLRKLDINILLDNGKVGMSHQIYSILQIVKDNTRSYFPNRLSYYNVKNNMWLKNKFNKRFKLQIHKKPSYNLFNSILVIFYY